MAAQFLVQGIRDGDGAVSVTFEEPADDLRQNLATLGWDIERWEAEDRWCFVDASPVGGFEALDSLNVVLRHRGSAGDVRQDLRQLAVELRRLHLTAVMNVVILRNVLEDEKRRRTVEVLKMRGAIHRKGEYPFTVLNGQGVVVVPLSVIELSQQSTDTASRPVTRPSTIFAWAASFATRWCSRLVRQNRQDADGHRVHRRWGAAW